MKNQKTKLVVKHNQLLNSTYKLSITEQRLLMTCITQIKRNEVGKINREFFITVDEYNKSFGTNEGAKTLRAAQETIMTRVLHISEPIEKDGQMWKGGGSWNFFSEALYKDEGMKVTLNDKIMPFLEGLSKNYTKYQLKEITQLKSVYSVRFYELFRETLGQYKNTRIIEIDKMRQMFELENKYSRTNDFKEKVIDRAIEEINEKSPMLVSFKPKKKGRKIISFEFSFEIVTDKEKRKKYDEIGRLIKEGLKAKKIVLLNGAEIVSFKRNILTSKKGNKGGLYEVLKDYGTKLLVLDDNQIELPTKIKGGQRQRKASPTRKECESVLS